ncbi:hypothetical protein GF378_00915 [Candidatus Pacearchaeota archaeon]|nr:hypothetical protein [Candidatus Pacearchaeota archaeon]
MAKKRKKKSSKQIDKEIIKSSNIKKTTGVIWKNLVLFIIFFVLSLVLYFASTADVYKDLFFVLSLFFGFVGIAFLIAFLVYFFLKKFK